jgi:hypothetical protein
MRGVTDVSALSSVHALTLVDMSGVKKKVIHGMDIYPVFGDQSSKTRGVLNYTFPVKKGIIQHADDFDFENVMYFLFNTSGDIVKKMEKKEIEV